MYYMWQKLCLWNYWTVFVCLFSVTFCLWLFFCDFSSEVVTFFQSPATSVSILHKGKDESRPLIVKATLGKPGRWGGQHNECSQVCKVLPGQLFIILCCSVYILCIYIYMTCDRTFQNESHWYFFCHFEVFINTVVITKFSLKWCRNYQNWFTGLVITIWNCKYHNISFWEVGKQFFYHTVLRNKQVHV